MSDTPPSPYVGNTTPEAIAAWLRDKRRVVLLTHTKPDGDAIGSTVALARAINLADGSSGASSTAQCWYAAPTPPWAPSVWANTKVKTIESGQPAPGAFDPEAVVICDTGAWNQVEPFAALIRAKHDECAVIDHHISGQAEVAPRRLIDTSAAAACQPVAAVCCALLGLDSPAELPKEVAEPLYIGLATDTGWFRHSNVSPSVFRLAGDLLGTGLVHAQLYERIMQTERPSRLRLMARALSSLELHPDRNLAIMSLNEHDFRECHGSLGETGGFVDIPQSVEVIRVVAMLNEQELDHPEAPLIKISMRSKSEPWDGRQPVDVARVCATMGGGGHARAAGARVRGTLAEVKRKIIEALA